MQGKFTISADGPVSFLSTARRRPDPARLRATAAILLALSGAVHPADAADGTKTDSTHDLNLPGSWLNGTLPDASGWGTWDTTQTSAKTALLGDDLTWGGIKTTSAYKGTIGATSGKTLTLMGIGGIGIDLSSAAADFAVAAQLKLGGSQAFTVTSGRTLTIDGAVDDGGGGFTLTKAGAGTLVLTGANSHGGGTALGAGTLKISHGGALGGGALSWNAGGTTLQIANTAAVSVPNAVALGDTAQTFTLVKNAVNNQSGTETAFNGVISGGNAGATLFLNTDTLSDYTTTHRFNGANTFRATVRLNRGAIVVGNPQGLGDTANVIYLDGNANGMLGDLRFAVSMTLTNAITLSTEPSPINTAANSVSLAGVVSGTGNQSLTKLGSGTLTLLAANTYSGGTALKEGSLTITNGNALGSGALSVNLANAGTFLTVANTNAVALPNAMVLPAPPTAQTYRLAKQSATMTNGTGLALSGNITGGNANTILQFDSSSAGDNSTTYRLSGANTFRATVNLNRGCIVVANAKGLGDVANLIYLNGNGNAVLGDLRFAIPMTLTNPVQLVNTHSPINTDAHDVTLAGAVSGNNMTKLGSGALTLLGANTYSGATAVSNGIFRIAGAGSLGRGTYAGAVVNHGTIDFAGSATQTLSGVISGSGTLSKSGSGTLTLSGVNTYSGATTVSGGRLVGVAGGACSNSAVTVQADGTLRVTTADAAKQWACAGLDFASGATTLEFTFGGVTPSTSVAPLRLGGNLTFNGSPAVTVTAFTLPVGTYPLVTWTGSLSGTAPTAVTLPPHVTGSLSVAGSTLYLNVTAATEPLRWALAGGGAWDVNATQNWKDNAGGVTAYQEAGAVGDSVVLDDTYISSPTAITLDTTVSPLKLTASNASHDYTVSGSGMIAGETGLTKTGGGRLTLNTANTYAGASVISGGTLSVAALANGGQPSGIGAAPAAAANLSLSGGATLQYTGNSASSDRGFTLGSGGATVDVSAANQTLTLSGTVAGAYPLTKAGAGNLSFTAANALPADSSVIVAAGDLQVGAWTVSATKTVAVASGATLTSTGSIQVPTANVPGPYTTFASGAGTWRLRASGASAGSPDIFAPNNDVNQWGVRIATPLDTGAAGTTRYICGYNQHCNPFNWVNNNGYGDLLFDGNIAGAGNLCFYGYPHAAEDMAFMLNADNVGFAGDVTILRGDLFLNHSNALTAANAVQLAAPGAGTNAALRIWNKRVTIGALSGGGINALVSGSGPLAALTVFQNADTSFAGTLTQQNAKNLYTSGSMLAFTKNGTGTLTLAWTNGYTGATAVEAGTLALGANGTLVSTNISIAAGATFDVTAKASYAMAANQAFVFGINPAASNGVGRLAASGLDISNARVSFSATGALTEKVYTVATYTNLTGSAFASVSGRPEGYLLEYGYNGTKQIALVRHVGLLIKIQ